MSKGCQPGTTCIKSSGYSTVWHSVFAYGVCIDANAQALYILNCQRSQVIGAAIAEQQDHRTSTVQQLLQVVRKLQSDDLEGILWRSDDILGG